MIRPTSGMMMSSTSDLIMAPKAAPMITPTARSTTLPLKANFRNSSHSDHAFLVAASSPTALTVSIVSSTPGHHLTDLDLHNTRYRLLVAQPTGHLSARDFS